MNSSDHVFDPTALAGAPTSGGGGGGSGDGGGSVDGGAPERELENTLRPESLEDFVGQPRAVGNLNVAIRAATARGESLDHTLLSGPPGLGKTSLARILSRELGTKMHAATGPGLERPRDLVGLLTQLKAGDVFFIDEIHRVPASVEEYLYTAMEDFQVDITLDQGPHARILPLKLEPFTLVGATTREGLLSAPFRSRFGLFERLAPYPTEDLVRILTRSARLLDIGLEEPAAERLAGRCRGTPRIANRFLRRARDLAQVGGHASISDALAHEALERMGIDEHGLEEMDRNVLRCLARAAGEPMGLKTIAAAVDENEDTIEDVFEPHLLRCGFMQKTARGRRITRTGCAAIGIDPDQSSDSQRALFS